MAGIPGSSYKSPRTRADNDLYTALVMIAFAFVLSALIYVIYRCTELFGTPFPGFAS